MRSIIIGTFLIAGTLQAKKLDVAVYTVPAMSVLEDLCSCGLRTDGSYLGFENRLRSHMYPGSVSVSISGGVAPYKVTWHEDLSAPFAHLSAMPGTYHVTIEDAAGDRITRSAHVGEIVSYQHHPCLPKQERKVIERECGEKEQVEQVTRQHPDPHVRGRHPLIDREVTSREDRWTDPKVTGDPDRGVDRTAPVERHSNGGGGTGGSHIGHTERPMAR